MTKEREIDNIYLMLCTSQFLVDFIEENMLAGSGWIKHDLKASLKTTVKKLQKVCDLPFEQKEIAIDKEVEEQAFNGSLFAENVMRLMMKVSTTLSEEEQLKFQLAFENMCTRFKISVADGS